MTNLLSASKMLQNHLKNLTAPQEKSEFSGPELSYSATGVLRVASSDDGSGNGYDLIMNGHSDALLIVCDSELDNVSNDYSELFETVPYHISDLGKHAVFSMTDEGIYASNVWWSENGEDWSLSYYGHDAYNLSIIKTLLS